MRRRVDSAVEVVAQTGRLRIRPDDATPFFAEPGHDFFADCCRGARGSLVHRPADLVSMPVHPYEEGEHERGQQQDRDRPAVPPRSLQRSTPHRRERRAEQPQARLLLQPGFALLCVDERTASISLT
jgi:hypothetical protein